MAYEYTDPRREPEGALPDVNIIGSGSEFGYSWYWTSGSPECPGNVNLVGPFTTYQEALDDARSHGDCFEDYDPKVDR